MTKNPAVAESTDHPVKTGQRLAWGAGSIAEGCFGSANGLVDQVFVIGMGLSAGGVSLARSLPLFADLVSNPLIGHLSDNTRTRWGRRKPWMVAGLLIAAFATVAMWHPPLALGEGMAIAYITVMSLLLLSVGYSLFTVPYLAMGFELSTKYEERTHIMQWRGYALAAAGFLTPWFIKFSLMAEGSQSVVWKGTHGVLWVSIGAAAVILITGLMPVWFCHEKNPSPSESKVGFLTAARYTASNRAFWPLIISNFLKRVGIQITGIFFYYIIIYRTAEGDNNVGATEWAIFCNVINGATFLATFPVVKFTDWLGKQQTLMLFMFLSAVTYASIWWTMRPGWWISLLVTAACIGVFCNTMPMIVNSMLADVCDEDEFISGHRREAFYGSVFVMTDKIAMAVTTLAQGWLLVASGFVASRVHQTPETLDLWMRWLIVTQPTGFVLGLFFILFYPITRKSAQRTRVILDERHRQAEGAS